MSDVQYEIDNDDNLFSFDPYDMLASRLNGRRARAQLERNGEEVGAGVASLESMPSPDAHFTSGEPDDQGSHGTPASLDKGKQRVSMPMPVRPPASFHDLFDVSPPTSGVIMVPTSSSFAPSDFSSFTSSSSFTFSSPGSSRGSYQPFNSPSFAEMFSSMESLEASSSVTGGIPGKGKGRELPPTLPPLALGSPQLTDDDVWMNFDPTYFSGPSSFSSPSSYTPRPEGVAEVSSPVFTISSSPPTSPEVVEDQPRSRGEEHATLTRTRSLSSISIDSATSSTTVNVRPKPARSPSTLAKKLLFGRKGDESRTRPATPSGLSTSSEARVDTIRIPTVLAPGNAPRQWYASPKAAEASAIVSRPPPPIPILALETAIVPNRRGGLKHKGRSHSSPLPFSSALDAAVPATSTDVFEPLPLIVKNYFDEVLPRELRLRVLQSLVEAHEEAHQRMVRSERWSVNRASTSRNQWVGRDRGIRELFKLSRVSKSWRSLIYDGQLWINVDLHSFPNIPRVILQHITESAGPFIQTLDVSGLTHLDSEKLLDVTSNLCLMTPYESLSYTQLTSISLQGCTGLTTRSLHHLLIRSRFLKKLNLRGLPVVTNTTCEILATYCPGVASLNLNRCPNMDADGIHYMATAALARGEHLQLRELKACGLKHTSDEMMADLGRAAPYLEVLDLSYARRLHNSALDAFVACDDEPDLGTLGVDTVVASARDLGRDINDASQVYFRRRVTRLRHLNLSFCILLTDGACANLAYSVPQLEFLELAGIGAELKDTGLIRLFERTPSIRRVDLEDAADVGDAVLAALTPPPPPPAPISESPSRAMRGETLPQTGDALEVLNVSSCINLNDAALLSLVRGCQRLTVLEADGTRLSSTLFREFVRLSKERKLSNSKLGAVDCRGVTEGLVKELQAFTRPRLGWRSYASRRLFFLDARDGHDDDMKVAGGQDECDENRVVVKTFYSWQTVDAVKASRERRKAKAAKEAAVSAGSSRGRRVGRGSDGSGYEDGSGRARWWAPGGRRGSGTGSSGRTSPLGLAEVNDGCRAM